MSDNSSWDLDPMIQGSLYRYRKVGRTLFSENALSDIENRWTHRIADIRSDDVVVFLEKCKGKDGMKIPFTMIKLLTSNGIVGWVSWNYGDWEKVYNGSHA